MIPARSFGLATRRERPTVKLVIHPCWLTRMGLMIASLIICSAVVRVSTMWQLASELFLGHAGALSGVVVCPSCTVCADAAAGIATANPASAAAIVARRGVRRVVMYSIQHDRNARGCAATEIARARGCARGGSDLGNAYRLGTLGALLLLVGDLRALGQ